MDFVLKEKFIELLQPKSLATVIALVLLGAVLLAVSRKARFNAKLISYGALCIAASFLLSYVKIFQLPNGGTITVGSMLPLFLFAFIAGPWAGIGAGLCYGMLQFIQEPVFLHPAQLLLDYPLAFAMLGIAGFFKNKQFLGMIAGGLGRFICHVLVGVIFFAEYANGKNVYLYSMGYNASYLIPDIIICLVLFAVPQIKNITRRVTPIG